MAVGDSDRRWGGALRYAVQHENTPPRASPATVQLLSASLVLYFSLSYPLAQLGVRLERRLVPQKCGGRR
jgi:hypothetical protein